MSVSPPGWFPVTFEPGCLSPGVAGAHQDDHHRMRAIVRVIPATDRM
jgi:hypothetical protein